MAFAPLHLGPNGFLGLILIRRIDLPVFLLAGVMVDVEVIIYRAMGIGPGQPRYGHTLLAGAAVGVLCALMAYPLEGLSARVMGLFRLPYEARFTRMLWSGIAGAWLHILVDGLYRSDVVLFWPFRIGNPLCRFGKSGVEQACLFLCIAAPLLYLAAAAWTFLRRRPPGNVQE